MKKSFFILDVISLILCISVFFANPISAVVNNDYILQNSAHSKKEEDFLKGKSSNIRYLDVRVMLDTTYIESKTSPYIESQDMMYFVDYPFIMNWNIGFNESFTNVGPLPTSYCTRNLTEYCSDSVCGSGCNNNADNIIHHKNAVKNLNTIKYYIPSTGYDIMITLFGTPLCGVWGGNHTEGILGVAEIEGDYMLARCDSYINSTARVRIIQHELSHLFGCVDGACTPNERCIMKGDFDSEGLYETGIWCTSCREDFNPLAH